jgi:hypothetical protein
MGIKNCFLSPAPICMTHRSAAWDRRGCDMGRTGDFRAHSLAVDLPMVGMLQPGPC